MTSPLAAYHADIQRPDFTRDPKQAAVVDSLENLYQQIVAQNKKSLGQLLKQRFASAFGNTDIEPIKGLYIWGGVGRGKTYLMDTFYEGLPIKNKMREHFHRFMRRVHHDLKDLAGHSDPLELVAERISNETSIICFDEFFVSDITDAMLLGNLFTGLFKRGVSLVATSNIPPHKLYENGLQRERFLPAIGLIEKHTQVIHLDSEVDYRLRVLERAELYHFPLGEEAEESLAESFDQLVSEHVEKKNDVSLKIEGRVIRARKQAEEVVWFDFVALCDGPRSQNDYIQLAKEFQTVLVSNVPVFTADNTDQARRFINLIDEFYDRNVKLVLSAAAGLNDLYAEGRLAFEFQRTASRLLEMQSHEYLGRPHRP